MALRSTSATFPVSFGARAWLRLFFFSLVGIAPAGVPAVLGPVAVVFRPSGADAGAAFLTALTGLAAFLACVIVPLVCLRIRHPDATTVTLDPWGATEREGDIVRTAASWSRAAVYQHQTLLVHRIRRTEQRVGAQLIVRTPSGHVIAAIAEVRWQPFRALSRPSWAFRRRAAVGRESINELAYSFDRAESLSTPPIDPRDARRAGRGWARALGAVTWLTLALAAVNSPDAVDYPSHRPIVGVLLGLASMFVLVRALRPWIESRGLRREASVFESAEPYQLTGSENEGAATAVDIRGATVTLDLREATHPDEALATRTTRVFARITGETRAGYRGAAMRVSAIETVRDRSERERILRANRIEIRCRLAFAALLGLDAVLWGTGVMMQAFGP